MKLLSKKSSVGGDAIYLTMSRVAVSLIGLVTSMLLARFRTLDEYGTYSQIIMVTDLVSTILMLGLPNSINYFLAKAETKEEKQRFMSIYVTLSTLLTVIIGVCLICAMPLIIDYFDNPAITAFAYVFAVYPWSSIMINSLGNICIVYEKANRLILYNVVYAIAILLILLFTKVLGMTFRQYMIIYVATMLLFALFALGWIAKMVGAVRPLLSSKMIKEIFIFSVPMGLASVIGTLNAELDKLVIGKFFTTEQYAIFANAAKELPVTMLAASLTAVLLPRVVRLLRDERREDVVRIWGCAANISFCFMFLIVGGFIVFAPDIMSFFYSSKYVTEGGVTVFRMYAVILIFRSIYWGIVLNASGKTNFIFISSILTLIFNFICNIVFCWTIGFVGPAIATLVVTCIMNFTQLLFTKKILKISISKLLPWRNIFGLFCETTAFGVVFWYVRYGILEHFHFEYQILISIALGGVWAILYGIVNIKFIKRNWIKMNKIEI